MATISEMTVKGNVRKIKDSEARTSINNVNQGLANLPNVIRVEMLDKFGEITNEWYQNTDGYVTVHAPASTANTKRVLTPIRLLEGKTYNFVSLYNGFSFICKRDSKQIITGLSAGIIPYTPTEDCDLYVTLQTSTESNASVYEIFSNEQFNTDKKLLTHMMPADAYEVGQLANKLRNLIEKEIPTQTSGTDTVISDLTIYLNRKYKCVIQNLGSSAGYVRFAAVESGIEKVSLGTQAVAALSTAEINLGRLQSGTLAISPYNLSVRNINGINFKVTVYEYTDDDFTNPIQGINHILIVNGNSDRTNAEFSSISDAVTHAQTYFSGNEVVDIYIKNGLYEVTANQSYEPYCAINISQFNETLPVINLHGESRDNTIIQMTCTEGMRGRVIDMGGKNQIIENLTIRNLKNFATHDGGKRPYAVHNDAGPDPDAEYKTTIKNCILYSECDAPIGAGLRHNQTQVYENVVFILAAGASPTNGVLYIHGPGRPQDVPIGVVIDNCTVISKNADARVVNMGSVPECIPYTEVPTTFRRTIVCSVGDDVVPSNFKAGHLLTIDSALNNNDQLNY